MMTLDQLRKLPWTLKISRSADTYTAYCPELSLLGNGLSLGAALAEFEERQVKFFGEMQAQGLIDQIPFPQTVARRSQLWRTLLEFWARHFALALFYALVFVGVGKVVGRQIGKGFEQISREYSHFTAADGDPTKASRLENFQGDLNHLSPFLKEIRKAWKETEP